MILKKDGEDVYGKAMNSHDKLERVLRDIHVMISKSEAYGNEKIILNKQELFGLIDRLNETVYGIMEDYELTKQSRDKALREQKKAGDQIVWEASRKAEDVYAASIMYASETLRRIDEHMTEAMEAIQKVQDNMLEELEKEHKTIAENGLELKSQIQDLVDTEKYLSLIEDRNKEIEKEKAEAARQVEPAGKKNDDNDQFAGVTADIKINKEYFRNAGLPVEDDDEEEDEEEEEYDESDEEYEEDEDEEYEEYEDEDEVDEGTPKKVLSKEEIARMQAELDNEYFDWQESKEKEEKVKPVKQSKKPSGENTGKFHIFKN